MVKKEAESPEIIKRRWDLKKEQIEILANNIQKLRYNVTLGLKDSDNEKVFLTALVVAIMLETSERVGNEASASNGHTGISGLKKNQISIDGNKVTLEYVGKSGVEHVKSFSDEKIAKALKLAIKRSKTDDVFCTSDGFKIKADRILRYLSDFSVRSKDLRSIGCNKLMIDRLKNEEVPDDEKKRKKLFMQSLRKVAIKIGHGSSTLRKHYLIPELETNYIKNGNIIDIRERDSYELGGEIEKQKEFSLTFYRVSAESDSDSEELYFGNDFDKAKLEYDSANVSDFTSDNGGLVMFQKYTNKYKFVYELDEEFETIEDYPIEDYYNDSDYYELIEEGEYEDIENRNVNAVNKESDDLLMDVENHYKKEYGNYKYNTISVNNEKDEYDDDYKEYGCIQLRIADHSENVKNIDKFGSCDYYISVVIANKNKTANKFLVSIYERRSNEIELSFDSDDSFEYIISEIDEKIKEGKEYILDKNGVEKLNKGGSINRKLTYLGEVGGDKIGQKSSLEKAKSLEKQGISNEQIRQETSWFKNPHDKKWRFEISDNDFEVIQSFSEIKNMFDNDKRLKFVKKNLYEVIKHDKLFEAYPEFKTVTFLFLNENADYFVSVYTSKKDNLIIKYNLYDERKRISKSGGVESFGLLRSEKSALRIFDIFNGFMESGTGKDSERFGDEIYRFRRNLLIHELQHVVQVREEFGGGSSPIWWYEELLKRSHINGRPIENFTDSDLHIEAEYFYQNSSGEIESKDVDKRLDFSEEKRKEVIPLSLIRVNPNYVTVDLEKNYFENGGELNEKIDCPNCSGSGEIKLYEHIEGGKCFTCGGKGHVYKHKLEESIERKKQRIEKKKQQIELDKIKDEEKAIERRKLAEEFNKKIIDLRVEKASSNDFTKRDEFDTVSRILEITKGNGAESFMETLKDYTRFLNFFSKYSSSKLAYSFEKYMREKYNFNYLQPSDNLYEFSNLSEEEQVIFDEYYKKYESIGRNYENGGEISLLSKLVGENPIVEDTPFTWNEEEFLYSDSKYDDKNISNVIYETPFRKSYFGGNTNAVLNVKYQYAVVKDEEYNRWLLLSRIVSDDGKIIIDYSEVGEYDFENLGIMLSHRGMGVGKAFVKELIKRNQLRPSIGYSVAGYETIKSAVNDIENDNNFAKEYGGELIEDKITFDNFYKGTKADFKEIMKAGIPKRNPDFVSNSGSKYWFTANSVIRQSDHWGHFDTCVWTLDGKNGYKVTQGICQINNFLKQ